MFWDWEGYFRGVDINNPPPCSHYEDGTDRRSGRNGASPLWNVGSFNPPPWTWRLDRGARASSNVCVCRTCGSKSLPPPRRRRRCVDVWPCFPAVPITCSWRIPATTPRFLPGSEELACGAALRPVGACGDRRCQNLLHDWT